MGVFPGDGVGAGRLFAGGFAGGLEGCGVLSRGLVGCVVGFVDGVCAGGLPGDVDGVCPGKGCG